ncbi:WD40 domain-containing protein [Microthyrium microscopicum]|uniref:WD repeat-containing protein JIP5 n=1 Tax=Microthyrium microscopicum TaxID=703497 RepID=A0A6A6U3U6_9PEZI|nr:WD40 domain-containing protein [Microthyrium microscopicum]
MFENLCTLPLTSELFTQAVHPNEPILAVGLSSGHVQCFRLPSTEVDDSSDGTNDSSRGLGQVETQWRTRRHKVSCRTLTFAGDGTTLYSAGADGLVKAASTETGQVSAKISIPLPEDQPDMDIDAASLLHVLSPQTLLLATDSSALHIYDLRAPSNMFASNKPVSTYFPHEDYISSLTPLPPSAASTSGFPKQWVTTGGTSLSVTDIRKGVLARSSDQDDELSSCLYVGGFSKRGNNVGEKIVVGDSSGVLTLWERGVWDDQDERIVLDRGIDGQGGENVECLSVIPADITGSNKMIAAGMGGGLIACVQLGANQVVDVFRHDEIEAVVGVDFDVSNRMISGGGQVVKIWQEKLPEDNDDAEEEAEVTNGAKRDLSEDDSSDESSSESEKENKQKKRRKIPTKNGNGHLGLFSGLD